MTVTIDLSTTRLAQIRHELGRVIVGQDRVVDRLLVAVLADGHVLLEGAPGLGKTLLLATLARILGGTFHRIQFTPDLIPSDIVGTRIFRPSSEVFDVEPGPIMANLVLVDEINRAPARVQSALLEAMAERQVTVDGTTYHLAPPFTVVATQNPIEMEGTYALPEAQRDRFMARISMGYPDNKAELAMLRARASHSPLEDVEPVVSTTALLDMIHTVRGVYVSPAVESYIVGITQATRDDNELRLGASPRATLQLMRAAKARPRAVMRVDRRACARRTV